MGEPTLVYELDFLTIGGDVNGLFWISDDVDLTPLVGLDEGGLASKVAKGEGRLGLGEGGFGRGELSLGDVDRGDLGEGGLDRGDLGEGGLDRGDLGEGFLGEGGLDRGDLGEGFLGEGGLDRGDLGEGFLGEGGLDRGDLGEGSLGEGGLGDEEVFCGDGSGIDDKGLVELKREGFGDTGEDIAPVERIGLRDVDDCNLLTKSVAPLAELLLSSVVPWLPSLPSEFL